MGRDEVMLRVNATRKEQKANTGSCGTAILTN